MVGTRIDTEQNATEAPPLISPSVIQTVPILERSQHIIPVPDHNSVSFNCFYLKEKDNIAVTVGINNQIWDKKPDSDKADEVINDLIHVLENVADTDQSSHFSYGMQIELVTDNLTMSVLAARFPQMAKLKLFHIGEDPTFHSIVTVSSAYELLGMMEYPVSSVLLDGFRNVSNIMWMGQKLKNDIGINVIKTQILPEFINGGQFDYQLFLNEVAKLSDTLADPEARFSHSEVEWVIECLRKFSWASSDAKVALTQLGVRPSEITFDWIDGLQGILENSSSYRRYMIQNEINRKEKMLRFLETKVGSYGYDGVQNTFASIRKHVNDLRKKLAQEN